MLKRGYIVFMIRSHDDRFFENDHLTSKHTITVPLVCHFLRCFDNNKRTVILNVHFTINTDTSVKADSNQRRRPHQHLNLRVDTQTLLHRGS